MIIFKYYVKLCRLNVQYFGDYLESPTWTWVNAWGFTLTWKGPDFVLEISPNMSKCDHTLKVCKDKTDPQSFSLGAQAFGAHLHHRIRTERHSYFILTDRWQPQRRIGLQLQRRNQNGLMAWVHTANTNTICITWTVVLRASRLKVLADVTWSSCVPSLTCRDTRGQSPGHSRGPGRWRSVETGTAHTAA